MGSSAILPEGFPFRSDRRRESRFPTGAQADFRLNYYERRFVEDDDDESDNEARWNF